MLKKQYKLKNKSQFFSSGFYELYYCTVLQYMNLLQNNLYVSFYKCT